MREQRIINKKGESANMNIFNKVLILLFAAAVVSVGPIGIVNILQGTIRQVNI